MKGMHKRSLRTSSDILSLKKELTITQLNYSSDKISVLRKKLRVALWKWRKLSVADTSNIEIIMLTAKPNEVLEIQYIFQMHPLTNWKASLMKQYKIPPRLISENRKNEYKITQLEGSWKSLSPTPAWAGNPKPFEINGCLVSS